MSTGYFVTGTDTGIGKTVISCALLHAFAAEGYKVAGMKPIAAGSENGRWMDVEHLLAASNVAVSRQQINPYAFHQPLAPHIAAHQAGMEINLSVIHRAYLELSTHTDIVIVEGVGGFLVPVNHHQTGADLAQALSLPVIMVIGMRLGCLNHALLTSRAIRDADLVLAGWVANCIDPDMRAIEENIDALAQRLKCPLLGMLPFDQGADSQKKSQLLDISKFLTTHYKK